MSEYQDTLSRGYADVKRRLFPELPRIRFVPTPTPPKLKPVPEPLPKLKAIVPSRRPPAPWPDPAKRNKPIKGLTCEQIIAVVASNYEGVTVHDILEYDRRAKINDARVMAMFLARGLLKFNSFPLLGRKFNRHHTDVLSNCRRLAFRIEELVAVHDKHAAIKAQLKAVADRA